MKIETLLQAIEHLEKAEELLRMRDTKIIDKHDDVYHDVVMSLAPRIRLLRNELHYLEKEKLYQWKKSINLVPAE